jgi:hypothetical protein
VLHRRAHAAPFAERAQIDCLTALIDKTWILSFQTHCGGKMTPYRLVVVLLIVLACCRSVSAGEKPAAANKLSCLERFAGEWTVEGKWSGGAGLRARSIYEWGLGKKILKAKTFVKDGDREYQRYEAVFAWHPEKKSLFQISFAYDGSMTQTLIDAKDDNTLHVGWTPFAKDRPSPIRQTLHFLDNDRFQWVVEQKQGDKWVQLIDATWKRKGK